MTKRRRPRWAVLIALASAGFLSGCYSPYGYYPWGYPYPQPLNWGYPYALGGYPNPPSPAPPAAPSSPSNPAPPNPAVGPPQPLNAPVQRTPLPPAS